jgi:hypothetical protein
MEDDLEQQVAELVAERAGVAVVDRVEHLVRFLEQVGTRGSRASARDPTDSRPARAACAMMSTRRPSASVTAAAAWRER